MAFVSSLSVWIYLLTPNFQKMEKIIDKSQKLNVSLKLINDKLNFIGIADKNEPVSIDYIPPYGDNLGYTSLELLLLSLTSCYGSALALLLRKTGKVLSGMEISAAGIRNKEHPTSFNVITIDFTLFSDANEPDVDKVIALAEERYCPVYHMIKGNVVVKTSYSIKKIDHPELCN